MLVPRLDDRLYRFVRLSNQLRCLLVHDRDVEKSAACMFVGSGNLVDPQGERDGSALPVNGLAHFCEHMLFLGTKKFPSENHYSKFIQQHGGSKNAATGEDYTYYYFDIKNDHFDEAIDIFSQFFKEPLFTESATERELNAVDSEFKKNISNESRAQSQIEKSFIAVPGSRLNRFGTGNLETLQIPNILDELRKFYASHYSSNLMNLVLVSRHQLDHLQALVEENFEAVENKNLPPKDFSGEVVFNREHSFGRMYKIIPKKNLRTLKMTWILPVTPTFCQKKSSSYISHVFGHEGPNSLLSQLISEGLCQSLMSSTGSRMNQAFDQFSITMSLTQEAEQDVMRVVERVYMFINKIRAEGVKDYIYREFQEKHEIDFQNITKMPAMRYANMLARRLNFMPYESPHGLSQDDLASQILYAPYAFKEFDKVDIARRLDMLAPENMYAIFTSPVVQKEKDASPGKFKQEYFYSTDFCIDEMGPETLERLSKVMPEPGMRLGNAPKNEFMPTAAKLVSVRADRVDKDKPSVPILIEQPKYELWFKQDDTFEQPLVKISCQITTNSCGFPYSTESAVLAMLWQKLLSEHVRELDYMADLAGISTNFGI